MNQKQGKKLKELELELELNTNSQHLKSKAVARWHQKPRKQKLTKKPKKLKLGLQLHCNLLNLKSRSCDASEVVQSVQDLCFIFFPRKWFRSKKQKNSKNETKNFYVE